MRSISGDLISAREPLSPGRYFCVKVCAEVKMIPVFGEMMMSASGDFGS